MSTALPWLRDRRFIVATVVAATLATFGTTITHDFVGGWDDGPLIVNNDLVNPPTTESLGRIWTQPHARMYIPAVYTAWWLLAQVATVAGELPGSTTLNPYVFHAANVMVHTINALLVYAILQILLKRDWPGAAGALAFALHPLQVEAVAWATGMKDLLWGFFALLALWQYLVFITERQDRPVHYALATLAFVAALLAKPSAVVVPFVAAGMHLIIGRRFILMLLPWAALSVVWMIVTARVQPTPDITASPLLHRPLIAADALGFYFLKVIWPARLGIDYGMRPDVIIRSAWWIFALLAAVAIALGRSRIMLAAGLIFVAGVLPVLGLTPFVFQWLSTVADRYVYLSMLGPALAVAWTMTRLRHPAAVVACAIILAALGARSIAQATTWKDSFTLMRHTLRINPDSPLANNHMGDHFFQAGDFQAARSHFERAIATKSDYLTARDNLAATLVRLGRYGEALDLMEKTLQLRRALPDPIRQPIDEDLARIRAVRKLSTRPAATHPAATGPAVTRPR